MDYINLTLGLGPITFKTVGYGSFEYESTRKYNKILKDQRKKFINNALINRSLELGRYNIKTVM